jgi:hypothetical protein
MLKDTRAGAWAWTTARRSGRRAKIARWNGSSDDGRCGPMAVPSGLIQTMSLGVSLPLSTPAGVIQMLSSSSRIDRLPPDRVVIPLR